MWEFQRVDDIYLTQDNKGWEVEDKNLDKEGDGDEDGEDEHAAQTIQVERSSSAPVMKVLASHDIKGHVQN